VGADRGGAVVLVGVLAQYGAGRATSQPIRRSTSRTRRLARQ